LSLIVTAANRHDVTQLEAVLLALMMKCPSPPCRRHQHLCADAGYRGAPAAAVMEREGYIAHVKRRTQKGRQQRDNPRKRAHRWIVELAHSWFNRFRKLLVRYEKLERSFVALNHLAAAIIVFRKVPMKVNIIYG
jgi:IS5 family transposase